MAMACWRPRKARGTRGRPSVGLEGASALEPPDGGGVDVVGPRDVGQRLAGVDARHGLLQLMGTELARAAEPDAAGFGAPPRCANATRPLSLRMSAAKV